MQASADGSVRPWSAGERLARLEVMDRALSDRLASLEGVVERLEGRLWWLVLSASAVGSAGGAAAASLAGGL